MTCERQDQTPLKRDLGAYVPEQYSVVSWEGMLPFGIPVERGERGRNFQ